MTKWTDEETATLFQMRREGHSFRDIAAVLGRPVKAVRAKFEMTNESDEQREIRLQRRRSRYKATRPVGTKARVHDPARVVESGRPTEDMLAERNRRLALSEPAFGDPLPGYSALDKLPSWRVDKLR